MIDPPIRRFYVIPADDRHEGPLLGWHDGIIIDRTTNCPAVIAGDLLADGLNAADLTLLATMLNRIDWLQRDSGLRNHQYGWTKDGKEAHV